MSGVSRQERMVRGARVSARIKAGSNPAPSSAGSKHEERAASTLRALALDFAYSHKHKSWARRWLRQHGRLA